MSPAAPRDLFVNLTVSDVAATRAFFTGLGFDFDPTFSDDSCACMRISTQAYVLFQSHDSFRRFTHKPFVDAHAATEVMLCVSAESRDAVDALADAALAAGAGPGGEPQDFGFMYGRSFDDRDGHRWEVMWMDPRAAELGPEEFAAQQQQS